MKQNEASQENVKISETLNDLKDTHSEKYLNARK